MGKGEVRANLFGGTRIPGCIVVVDKENAVDHRWLLERAEPSTAFLVPPAKGLPGPR
ncbi:MAG: hypothetical protein OXU69_09490 [Gemmatimonadota bacterium]|nr:hypothetical protein [Gemmatimonadota bacterium]